VPDPIELLPPGEARPDNPRWHELRRAGITASEIAVVMGISPWESPFSLYWKKTNAWDGQDSELMSTGRHLEDAIADWWMAERDPLQNLVGRPAGLYAHPERRWQLATPDRLIHLVCACCEGRPLGNGCIPGYGCECCRNTGIDGPAHALLECKWVAHSWDGWGDPDTDQVPVYYRAQALWQLDVLGVDEVHFAALGPGGFRSYRVRRDDNDLALMRKAGEDFHRRLVDGDPPDLDSHSATLGALKRLYPGVGDGDVEVSVELAEEYRKARADKAAAEARIDACEARIRALLGGDHARAVVGKKLVASRSVYERKGYEVKPTTIDKLNPGRAESYV
jgi:putative phage-type endonuclease